MPIYRTVSDRGLWKKYQKAEQAGQPQHFHKPQYLDRNKPVVSIKLPSESDKNVVVIVDFSIFWYHFTIRFTNKVLINHYT